VREIERRYYAMSQLGIRNVGGYNERVAEARAKGEVVTRRVQTGFDPDTGKPTFEEQPLALETLPFIVVLIDEMADLMMVAGKETETVIRRITERGGVAGVHIILATNRASDDTLTEIILETFPSRLCYRSEGKVLSKLILGEQGAEHLPAPGDMLYKPVGSHATHVYGPFVEDREVEEIVAFLRAQGEPCYVEEITKPDDDVNPAFSSITIARDGEMGLFDQAVVLVAREGKVSTSFIQRHLEISHYRAARLVEQMEKEGVVTAANHVGKREVLVQWTEED
jgi:S-DNA-T family DNA segregation ATPase FtsK/SpoIIIE